MAVLGASNANDTIGEATNTIMHEVGHVLGLTHERNGDEITQMFAGTLPATSCSTMQAVARKLLLPANPL